MTCELLNTVGSPADPCRLDHRQFGLLTNGLRAFAFDSIPRAGGHLSSNLSMVELTTVLRYVFNMLENRIAWDVGH